MDERLTTDELIREARVPASFVDRLLAAGAISRDGAGLHAMGQAVSVRLAYALAEGGVDMEAMLWAVSQGILPLDRLAGVWQVSPPGTLTDEDVARRAGVSLDAMVSVRAAFGLAGPDSGARLSIDEAAILERFVTVWRHLDARPEVLLRAARIAGEGVRRIEVGTLDLFDEVGGPTPQRLEAGQTEEDATKPSTELASLMGPLMGWLHARYLEHEGFERIVRSVQDAVSGAGLIEPATREHPGVAFVDVSGYTQLTQAIGDERASDTVLRVQALADATAQRHGGRVVKVLGDGVLLTSETGSAGAACVLELMEALRRTDLPPAHAGIASGPVVRRDGDIYGHTVNLAARIAAHAGPHEVLLAQDLADRIDRTAWRAIPLGPITLKGIHRPIELTRLVPD